ncbi:nicotinate-nucleotide pyrophosphorylase [Aneurinibacillus migulanus]|uniref:Probable nicotinate-nucleotide pyrophosphorylase [carboxylating] n=1 Tax=Aneurinibacillus migulanus TaxID=47500 RepID=A0A0D1Y610_ANEMI|nr:MULTISPECIES: carboxylating nicotinate-nucleotide diphosphorylase [Aneurinibacillus]KIV59840.1 nicotinate-nucleotide pyrophosphorylase [Aneurinibacillus migulanus]KIV59893.1 nicotinate-nucleotide pyrophosphorylase [Aneurinibacillus migulanus]KON83462.1 nicotinate-nucleotide pyrophosphorylase [Aneurinibacillus migulanus]KPD06943.1 nicotinate-nucleotide pyrophosphorylase [Aneurinibacillus migulanus]MCP1358102.1 carboxylating nicotinate-nucleotide diphosphorylase [Aneurinibacillus migulanus]
MKMNEQLLNRQIETWLQEDIGFGDVTSLSTVPENLEGIGILYAKQSGVIAGLTVAERVFSFVDAELVFSPKVAEGAFVEKGAVIAQVEGRVQSVLGGERLALNLLQRLSGIATMTSKYVEKVRKVSEKVRIVDTRKTTPGLRMLEKYAVTVGGGHNHRLGLFDAVMIKDNHIKAAGGIHEAVSHARAAIPHTMRVEVEVETLAQLEEAIAAKPDIIMLDNMDTKTMTEAVCRVDGRMIVEASGGVSLDTVEEIAATGVDVISVGSLTHSVTALDISLDLNERKR